MRTVEMLNQIIGCLVEGQSGEQYKVTGWKQLHEMFEPYIELTPVGNYIQLPIYVSLSAYDKMISIGE